LQAIDLGPHVIILSDLRDDSEDHPGQNGNEGSETRDVSHYIRRQFGKEAGFYESNHGRIRSEPLPLQRPCFVRAGRDL
jgi:hypothetical protein